MGAARVIKARVQALQSEFETMFMGEEESVANFANFDAITSSIKKIS